MSGYGEEGLPYELNLDDFTEEEKERLIVSVYYPTRMWRWTTPISCWLYALSERWMGCELEEVPAEEWKQVPIHARAAATLASWLGDLSIWTTHRKAARRMRKRR